MKALLFFILLLLLGTSAVYSGGLELARKVREYLVKAEVERNPLIIGENDIEIEIKDDSGKNITDAKVLVNYYMPPMPRMVPMNYKAKADLHKDKYAMTMNIIMAGPWYIRIIIDRGGQVSTIKFNMDAQ